MRGNEKINNAEYIGWKEGIKIDFYYSRPIGGIEIDDIMRTAEERPLTRHETAKVVNPALLIMMKLEAGREKDKDDIANIISSLYGSVDNLMRDENEIIATYFKNAKNEEDFARRLKSILNEVDFASQLRH